MTTLYDNLGVSPEASQKEIKKAFRKKAKENHPDKGGDTEEFKSLVRAYEILSNPVNRERYDKTGSEDVSSIDKKAFQLLQSLFSSLVIEVGIELLTFNVMKALENKVAEGISKAKENKKQAEEKKRAFTKIVKRVIHKDEHNPFTAIINGEIAKADKVIEMAKEDKEVLTLAKKMLKDYDFIFDKEETIQFRRFGSSTSIINWGVTP